MAKTKKHALVLGVSGQDGAYLADFLLKKGYVVSGTSREAEDASLWRLKALGIRDQLMIYPLHLNQISAVKEVIQTTHPDEIYHLSGQSSVAKSYEYPQETMDSIFVSTLNVLEAITECNPSVKFFQACSGDCYGASEYPVDESVEFNPKSPYAIAKSAAYRLVEHYRKTQGLFLCSGILFNHESPLRGPQYVTRKITKAAVDICLGKQKELVLGSIDIVRDWGYAPDYVEAMYCMLQNERPSDYIIATGKPHSIREFCERAFVRVGLDYRSYVKTNADYQRPNEIWRSVGNPNKIARELHWTSKTTFDELVSLMVDSEKAHNEN